MIAAASQRTRRLRFANMVNILPFRNPLLVAEEAAMLDNLTGGRLDLGLGRGLRPPEFEAFGVDQAQSHEMFVESFNLIRRIWADENFVHHGKYWTVVKNGPLSPPLVQRPHRRSWSARPDPESQVRIRLPAGGKWIRTFGPAPNALRLNTAFLSLLSRLPFCQRDSPFRDRGTIPAVTQRGGAP